MPIIIDRQRDDEIIKPEISQQQKEVLWERFIREWLRKHPEEFKELVCGDDEKEA